VGSTSPHYLNANLHICALHITSDGYHNIQIQANKQAKKASVKKIAPNTVATVLVKGDADPQVDPNDVRTAFRESFDDGGRVIKLGQSQEMHAYERCTPMRDAPERHAYEMAPVRNMPMRDAPMRDMPTRWPMEETRL
jgi:hypothetical protein